MDENDCCNESRQDILRLARMSFRALLIGLTIICVVLGYWVFRAERQRAAVKWVASQGGRAFYHSEAGDVQSKEISQRPADWQSRGNDYLSSVIYVDLSGSAVENVTPLAKLDYLGVLTLRDTNVLDLEPLSEVTTLQDLFLDGTPVDDLTPLIRMSNLQSLYLDVTVKRIFAD